jgi:hypothetical protein
VLNSSDVYWEKAARPQQNQAKSVILNGRQLFLKECAKCGDDFYGVAMQTRCNACVANTVKRAS